VAGHSGPGTQATGGVKSAAGTAGAAGEGTGSAAGVAGAAAAAGAAPPPPSPTPPSPPAVTPLQRVVRNASQSHRLPRRLRHAIPRDPSAGVATAIVAGATAAAVVVIVVIAVIASALTSGNSAPQAGSGNAGPAAIGAAASSASATSQASTSCGGLLTAWAALPLTTASFTASVQQEIATCTGHVVSVSCSNTYGNSIDYDYTCAIPAQEAQELSMYSTSDFQASPKTGNWAYDGVGQN
jgi:hypothetical protein